MCLRDRRTRQPLSYRHYSDITITTLAVDEVPDDVIHERDNITSLQGRPWQRSHGHSPSIIYPFIHPSMDIHPVVAVAVTGNNSVCDHNHDHSGQIVAVIIVIIA